jgi:hypothetical protein
VAVPALGALASAILALSGLTGMAAGAVCGTVVASASWLGLHHLGRRLVGARDEHRTLVAVLLVTKFVAVSALVLVAVTVLGIDGIGMAVGLSAMPVGVVLMAAILGTGARHPGRDQATEVKGDA